MQSFNTEPDDTTTSAATDRTFTLGELNKIQPGEGASLDLPDGDQLAVFNVDGEYYAIENFCPHKGAPLSEVSYAVTSSNVHGTAGSLTCELVSV